MYSRPEELQLPCGSFTFYSIYKWLNTLASVLISVFVSILMSTLLSVLPLLSRETLVKREIKDTLESQACQETPDLLAERAIRG